jgi:hypothetical protein
MHPFNSSRGFFAVTLTASLEFIEGLKFNALSLSILSAILLTSSGQPTPCNTGLYIFFHFA